ncbi:putative SET domain [Monocercomonoides exilis]|uniref:putative SET domain n=1 Tax=Monocercomonoides exilis TaxID=2049356 RepID=UPI00355A674F|nr:putative SET domain [Monocercomonoides exilis]|eukprot:MONOS_4629.1-p1 / transcript=MONOS_4629.1 / gene=MONOS_4629 / organism=Monocercomonoides_exilis_PA203 / gene_product=unspecified product / transcript_product=unspecified product / location=Mono_scaffold00125:34418-37964(-) / protein_length=1160 / sequence_SO=supercontig / SO=protein_coding / is_pseudo=false
MSEFKEKIFKENCPFCVYESNEKGRGIIATQPINPGNVILRESAIVLLLYTGKQSYYCSYCSDKLNLEKAVHCEKCSKVFYCNERCRNADLFSHRFECRAYCEALDNFCSSDDLYLARILSVLYYNEILSQQINTLTCPHVQPFSDLSPVEKLFDLTGHEGSQLDEIIETSRASIEACLSLAANEELLRMCQTVVKYGIHKHKCAICGKQKLFKDEIARHCCLKESSSKSFQHILSDGETEAELICLFDKWKAKSENATKNSSSLSEVKNCRSFLKELLFPVIAKASGICDCNAHTIFPDTGFGVYHFGSMFNHSCAANAAFCHDSKGRILIVSLRPIRTAEEIFVDYCDVNMRMEQRQSELSGCYHFSCQCERCVRTLLKKFGNGVRKAGISEDAKLLDERFGRKAMKRRRMQKQKERKMFRRKKKMEARAKMNDEEKSDHSSSGNSNSSDEIETESETSSESEVTDSSTLYGEIDEYGGFGGAWGMMERDDTSSEEDNSEVCDESKEQCVAIERKEVENISIQKAEGKISKRQKMNHTPFLNEWEIPKMPDYGEEINSKVELDVMKQRISEMKNQSSSFNESSNKTAELQKSSLSSFGGKMPVHPYVSVDEAIFEAEREMRMMSGVEWDDVLACWCCWECGSPLKEVRTSVVKKEIEKMKEREKERDKREGRLKKEQTENEKSDEEDEEEEEEEEEEEDITYYLDQLLERVQSYEWKEGETAAEEEARIGITNEEREIERALSDFDGEESIESVIKRLRKLNEDEDGGALKEKVEQNCVSVSTVFSSKETSSFSLSPFSSDYRDYKYVYFCRHHPIKHKIIAGNRAMLFNERMSHACRQLNRLWVRCENLGVKLPLDFPEFALSQFLGTIRVFQRLLHPFNELLVEAVGGYVTVVYNSLVVSNMFEVNRISSLNHSADKQKAGYGISPKEKSTKSNLCIKELSNESASSLAISATSSSTYSSTPSLSSTHTALSHYISQHLSFSPRVFLSPFFSQKVVSAAARYFARIVQLLYYPSAPRRVLDLKMCGIVLMLCAEYTPKDDNVSNYGEEMQHQTEKSFSQSVFADGVSLLLRSKEEGIVCFGENHCEIKEIDLWLKGGWKKLWHYQRRQKAYAFLALKRAKEEMMLNKESERDFVEFERRVEESFKNIEDENEKEKT